jgi:hypothetical protein
VIEKVKNMNEERTVTGYMCKVDWDFEIGNASDGNKVFPSVANLKEHLKCTDECGIVEVEVRLKRVMQDGQF